MVMAIQKKAQKNRGGKSYEFNLLKTKYIKVL